ncbi:hypothetical protein Tco_0891765 [Tanacetum coccineum]|uniref:Uncharacterized protein n=1 Tax=Tanacetum coccineum TaxID=301880 RepID=A0ABQ5C736_9ASTR
MTRKLDDIIELPKSQPKRTYNKDLECEIVMVKMPKCMAWLDDEPLGDLDTIEDKVDNPSPQCTPQFLLLVKVHTPPVTHPEEVEKTIGIPMEENKLEYEDEDEVKIKMMGTGMDKESLEHNLYEDDITPIICHNFSPTSNPPIKLKDSGSFRMKVIFDEKKL